jgi:hypothetical protein
MMSIFPASACWISGIVHAQLIELLFNKLAVYVHLMHIAFYHHFQGVAGGEIDEPHIAGLGRIHTGDSCRPRPPFDS